MADFPDTNLPPVNISYGNLNNISVGQYAVAPESALDYIETADLNTFYDMIGLDVDCGSPTYRFWTVADTPDMLGSFYTGTKCGASGLSNIGIVRKYKDKKTFPTVIPTPPGNFISTNILFDYNFLVDKYTDIARTTPATIGNVVRGFTDQSGNANHGTATASGPTSTVNGVTLAGVTSGGITSASVSISGYTSIFIGEITGASGCLDYIKSGTPTAYRYKPNTFTASANDGINTSTIEASPMFDVGNHIYIVRSGITNQLEISRDGVIYGVGTGTIPKIITNSSWYLGQTNTGTFPLAMNAIRWIAYNGYMTDADVLSMVKWSQNTYGTP